MMNKATNKMIAKVVAIKILMKGLIASQIINIKKEKSRM